jgi:hypothetical protein
MMRLFSILPASQTGDSLDDAIAQFASALLVVVFASFGKLM